MMEEYVNDIAKQLGIALTKISLVQGKDVGCIDMNLLLMTSRDKLVSALVHRSELENIQSGIPCDHLELNVRKALSRLKTILEPMNS